MRNHGKGKEHRLTAANRGKSVCPVKVSPVNGGWIKRDSASGRLTEVHGGSGTSRASRTSEAVVHQASEKHREALKRLADR